MPENPTRSPLAGRDLPWDEPERLRVLESFGIVDTPREADFDDIVALAASIFETPIALINLIGADRQWFKAEIGIGTREMPIDHSICAHNMLEGNVMVVSDTTADPRFDCNPLVTVGDGLRFYAGALLKTSDGLPMGTLCVLDRVARPGGITDLQRMTLEVLARQVMTQIELRRLVSAMAAAEAHRVLLTDELQHRVKNTLSVVQGIVSQSLRIVATPAEARIAIADRLVTLAHAHDVLTQTSWTAAPIASIIDGALFAHLGDRSRVTVSGPPMDFNPRAALALSMALHELFTNAVKYGCLSNQEGRLALDWQIGEGTGGADDARPFLLSWRETGGPPVIPPTKLGFGARLTGKSLAGDLGGRGLTDYAPDGVRWTLATTVGAVSAR